MYLYFSLLFIVLLLTYFFFFCFFLLSPCTLAHLNMGKSVWEKVGRFRLAWFTSRLLHTHMHYKYSTSSCFSPILRSVQSFQATERVHMWESVYYTWCVLYPWVFHLSSFFFFSCFFSKKIIQFTGEKKNPLLYYIVHWCGQVYKK